MAVSMRLSRGGSKKRPYYRIVIADARSPRDGNFIEKIGTYNPLLAKDDEKRVQIDTDRAKHWLEVGAQPTDRVHRFLGAAGLTDARPVPEKQTKQAEPKAKAQERMKEREEKAKAEAEAAAEAAAAPPEEEAPAEEAAAEAPAEEAAAEEAPAEQEEETKE